MSEPRTRSQRMAGLALQRVEQVAAGNTDLARDYRTRALGFPALVMQSGLAQAVGFLRAKSGDDIGNGYGRFLADLAAVVGVADGEKLHKRIIAASLPEYRLLTRDALDAGGWIKRFVQTLLKSESDHPDAAS